MQVAELETEAAAIDQEYVGVKESLAQSKAQLKQKKADLAAQTKKVERLRVQAGQAALAQYQNRHLDTAAKLLLSDDTEDFLSQVSTLEKVSENQNSALQDYQSEQAKLADLERSTETETTQLTKEQAELSKLRKSSDSKITDSKKVLDRLTEEERQRIAAEANQAQATSQAAAESASTDTSTTVQAGSSKGAIALAFAKSQLGKPYRYAAAGPDAYDCSGLTMASWAKAGVSLPRTSQAQIGAGQAVSKSDLQPGDLVFYYSGISHVALYAGNGQVLHAPHPGASVEYAPLDSMPFAGARRPG